MQSPAVPYCRVGWRQLLARYVACSPQAAFACLFEIGRLGLATSSPAVRLRSAPRKAASAVALRAFSPGSAITRMAGLASNPLAIAAPRGEERLL